MNHKHNNRNMELHTNSLQHFDTQRIFLFQYHVNELMLKIVLMKCHSPLYLNHHHLSQYSPCQRQSDQSQAYFVYIQFCLEIHHIIFFLLTEAGCFFLFFRHGFDICCPDCLVHHPGLAHANKNLCILKIPLPGEP